MVVGADGKDYGPVGVDVLRQWVQENRIKPDSVLKDFASGAALPASSVPGLFAPPQQQPPVNWAQPPVPSGYRPVPGPDPKAGQGALWGSIIRSILAVVFFFLLHGLGVFFAAYALYYAIQAKAHGNRYGNVAIAIASFALVAVLIGWYLRVSSGQPM